jgi:hypothetical protein
MAFGLSPLGTESDIIASITFDKIKNERTFPQFLLKTTYKSNRNCAEADAVILIGQLASSCSGNITPIERLDASSAMGEILETIRWSYLCA